MATDADLTAYLDAARDAIDRPIPDMDLARRKVALAKIVLAELEDAGGSDGTTYARGRQSAIQAIESAIDDVSKIGNGGYRTARARFA